MSHSPETTGQKEKDAAENPKEPTRHSGLGRYAYFSGVGFQMIAVIGVFTYIGHLMDARKEGETLLWTALFALIGVCLSIFTTIRMVVRKK
jgi:uncharacterized membrane protein YhaH (DUF805 family)